MVVNSTREFFVTIAQASAELTGLLFVAYPLLDRARSPASLL